MVPDSEGEAFWDEVLEKAEARLFPNDCGQWHSVVKRDCTVHGADCPESAPLEQWLMAPLLAPPAQLASSRGVVDPFPEG